MASVTDWKEVCKFKDRLISLYDVRWQSAKEVIDLIAEEVGLKKAYVLYGLYTDDNHPIVDAIREYISRAGDKAVLKKQIAELEQENALLRSLIGKGGLK